MLRPYLPSVRPGGRVVFITPQERGFASDPTHVEFTDHEALAAVEPRPRTDTGAPVLVPVPALGRQGVRLQRVQLHRPGPDRRGAGHDRRGTTRRSRRTPLPADRQLHDPDPEELLLDELAPEDAGSASSAKRKTLALVLRIVGIGLALAAVTLCVLALVDAWPTVSEAISNASPAWLVAAMVASALSMTGTGGAVAPGAAGLRPALAVRQGDSVVLRRRAGQVPARRDLAGGRPGRAGPPGGVARSTAYATTLLSLALMCVGAAIACGLLAPFLALDGGRIGLPGCCCC